MSARVTMYIDYQKKNKIKTRHQSQGRNIENGNNSSRAAEKHTNLARLSSKSKSKANVNKIIKEKAPKSKKVKSKLTATQNDNTMLKKKRDRSKKKKPKTIIVDRQLLDFDKIRKEISPPYSLKSYYQEEDHTTTMKSQVKDTIDNIKANLQNEHCSSLSISFGRNKNKKNQNQENPVPQKESGYLLRKRLPHQLSHSIDGGISCHNCKEIESVNYFQICSKDECRESYCLKCIEEYNSLDQSTDTIGTNNEKWICFKCQNRCKCLKCQPEAKDLKEEYKASDVPTVLEQNSQVPINPLKVNTQISTITNNNNNKVKKSHKHIIRIQMNENNKLKPKHNKCVSNKAPLVMKRVDIDTDCYIYELPLSHSNHSREEIGVDEDKVLLSRPRKSRIMGDDIIDNKNHCEQYYFLKSIKTNKPKIKKSCAVCFHSPFNSTELVRFKAIEEFVKYLYYCYNAQEKLLCYNKAEFIRNQLELNYNYDNKVIQYAYSIIFYKSMAICKMCIIKALNNKFSLQYLIEKLKWRNNRDKEKIVTQKIKEKQQQQKQQEWTTQSKPSVFIAEGTNPNWSEKVKGTSVQNLSSIQVKEKAPNNSNDRKTNLEVIISAHQAILSQNKSVTPSLVQKVEKKPNFFSIPPSLNATNIFNYPIKSSQNKSTITSVIVNKDTNNSRKYLSQLKREQFAFDVSSNPPQKASLRNVIASPLSTLFNGFPSSPHNSLGNYAFDKDIYLSIQQITNSLNTVITELFVMLSLLLKKNNQDYFTSYITAVENNISLELNKAYNTMCQLFSFLEKQRALNREIQMNIQKLKVISSDKDLVNEIENESNIEIINFENNYLHYESVINEYLSKFNLSTELIKTQKKFIERYSSLTLLPNNKLIN